MFFLFFYYKMLGRPLSITYNVENGIHIVCYTGDVVRYCKKNYIVMKGEGEKLSVFKIPPDGILPEERPDWRVSSTYCVRNFTRLWSCFGPSLSMRTWSDYKNNIFPGVYQNLFGTNQQGVPHFSCDVIEDISESIQTLTYENLVKVRGYIDSLT